MLAGVAMHREIEGRRVGNQSTENNRLKLRGQGIGGRELARSQTISESLATKYHVC